MFNVYSNGKPASIEGYPDYDASWSTHRFETLSDARGYARAWLGEFADVIAPDWDGSPIDYSGFGDTIEIREEP